VSALTTVVARIGHLIYPRRCLECGKDLDGDEAGPLCADHHRAVVLLEDPFCERCGQKMFTAVTGELLCAECRTTTRHFDRAFSATAYNDVMKSLVHHYKYGMRQHLAVPLARWMVDFAHRQIDAESLDAIVPVPLHWRRFQYRGFNQAIALARPLAREFRLPIIRHVLRRKRHTLPQVQLGPEERLENIKGAFGIRKAERVEGKHLLLVDDVYTTGATINECARVLKGAGADSVVAFTLTRPIG
jgi:ComF family protein